MAELTTEAVELIEAAVTPSDSRVVFLTGAGISAESGIPTFRGEEGYWVAGGRNYHPQELATHRAFVREPETVWSWYLYRTAVCRKAAPNAAHHALAELDGDLAERFLLITQNVDGLHLRAGSPLERTYQIHGNLDRMRCGRDCCDDLFLLPEGFDDFPKDGQLTHEQELLLRCPKCGFWARPHVLWFDECYDEAHFRFDSSLRAAASASLLVIVGTAGATNLPNQVAALAAKRGAAVVAVNLEPSPFTELADRLPTGATLLGRSGDLVPPIVEHIRATVGRA